MNFFIILRRLEKPQQIPNLTFLLGLKNGYGGIQNTHYFEGHNNFID
jgi:hypothetical protein